MFAPTPERRGALEAVKGFDLPAQEGGWCGLSERVTSLVRHPRHHRAILHRPHKLGKVGEFRGCGRPNRPLGLREVFTRPSSLRYALTTLLTAWVTAVSLGVWVRHAHDGAATPHVHGWGWCPGGCPKAQSAHWSESGPVHRHLLFCGIECPNEPPADGDAPAAPADGVSVIGHPCERPIPAAVTALADAATLLPAPPPPASDTPAVERDRLISCHLPLSAFTRRQVSGVLRS
jgi:hypothetical protein